MKEPLSTDQIFIRKLVDIVLANLRNENFGGKELAQESGLSLYNLKRKLLAATQKSVNQFIREIRLRKAMEMLKNEDLTASEVAYKTGFSSPNYFNTSFHEFFGYPPGKVKKGDREKPDEDIVAYFTSGQKHKKSIRQTFPFYKAGIPAISLLVVMIGILFYLKIFRRRTLDDLRSSDGRITIAVMPFQNLTNDTIWNVWQDGIQLSFISSLSNADELKVRQKETINTLLQTQGLAQYSSISPGIAGMISKKLDADIFIYGGIQRAGSGIRLNAQLIDTKTKDVLKSFEINSPYSEEKIIDIIDSLRKKVTDFLIISKLGNEIIPDFKPLATTKSPEAYRYFIYANNASMKGDFATGASYFSQALAIDSNLFYATIELSLVYQYQGLFDQAKKLCLKVYQKKDQMPEILKIHTNQLYAFYFETPLEQEKYLKLLLEFDDQMPTVYMQFGIVYHRLSQYDKAIPEYEKALQIYKKWGSKPLNIDYYTLLGYAYHKTGQYRKEKKLYKKAEKDFPNERDLLYQQAILSLNEGDTVAANGYIEKLKTILKENSSSEADIVAWVASVYNEAGILDKSEEYCRQVLSLEPENPNRMYLLGYFLINKDRNINEGLELIDKALVLNPDNYDYLDTKGLGLYKQGNYNEALDILQQSWKLRRKNAIYDHKAFLHLEAAKKAVADLKNN
jgi:tetratricopeptide (TPR) repeat protein/AraC-like DNA-binding protein